MEQQYYQSGEVIGSASSTQLFEGKSFVHIEAYKVLNGQVFSVDPTQFLQPDLNVNVNVEFDCNDLVTYVGGAVVERRSVATSDEVSRTLVGDPLVQGNELKEVNNSVYRQPKKTDFSLFDAKCSPI